MKLKKKAGLNNGMRKKQKQEILEFITSLYEAHKEIGIALEQSKYLEGQNMLCECQECAIELGNIIESMGGDEVVTISYIEKYCELLYRYYEKLSTIIELTLLDNQNLSKEINDVLNTQLSSIENSIKEDIKEKKEIVFLPYKISMWDSLESVYLAAKEDENCDVYCVPIPYFDRNADGSLGEMHYEGNEYPDNVEITDWNIYDLESRKPDVVYIHNPYDDVNKVTCVHPRFFSSNLKKYTEELVYIPYFILKEIEPDNQRAIDNMKHFISLPGVLYADKVILQSEKMRQIYINELSKIMEAIGKTVDKESLEKKFLGTGSPKLYRLKNTKVEDIVIPEQWKKNLQKTDGTRKKAIFYNTTISAMLKNDEQMLEKIKSVLQIFKERQEEVALIWRPHPLIETTIKSMCPSLWEEYSKIVEQYKQEGWGIYDDTPNMDKAILLSDAYYGDMGSVIQLYKVIGKPMMVQNVNVL